jgi:hypothetical protein
MNGVFNILGYLSKAYVKSLVALFFLNFFCLKSFSQVYYQNQNFIQYLKTNWKIKEATILSTKKNAEIYSDAVSENKNNFQTLDLITFGHHEKSCEYSFARLKNLEQYPKHISYIKNISYNHSIKQLSLSIDHLLLPFPMVVNILIDYPSTIKNYPFVFPDGFLKNLKGQINIIDDNGRCIYFVEAHWIGDKTKINSALLALIAETLSEVGAKSLFRISK